MPKARKPRKSTSEKLRRARITTNTADEMLSLLKGRAIEVVGRGPRRAQDGTYFAEVIAEKAVLAKLPKGDWKIEIRKPRAVRDAAKQVSGTNRYAKRGSVPKGLGVKKK